MKISNVNATTHTIPVDIPLLNTKTHRSVTFTVVETDEGITGYGLTSAPQRFGIKEFINKEVAPFLKGKNPLETERGWVTLKEDPGLGLEPSVVRHKSLYFDCHSERSEESRLFKYMRPFTSFRVTRKNLFQHPANVKKCWTHYTRWDALKEYEER